MSCVDTHGYEVYFAVTGGSLGGSIEVHQLREQMQYGVVP